MVGIEGRRLRFSDMEEEALTLPQGSSIGPKRLQEGKIEIRIDE